MWSALTGRGIVHPADEINARNVPSHPELLEWLAKDFAESGYDVRRFVRGVVLSRVYGLSAGEEETPPDAFAKALERPLTGERDCPFLARCRRVDARRRNAQACRGQYHPGRASQRIQRLVSTSAVPY
jgi:hypothetical protein